MEPLPMFNGAILIFLGLGPRVPLRLLKVLSGQFNIDPAFLCCNSLLCFILTCKYSSLNLESLLSWVWHLPDSTMKVPGCSSPGS